MTNKIECINKLLKLNKEMALIIQLLSKCDLTDMEFETFMEMEKSIDNDYVNIIACHKDFAKAKVVK